MNDAASSPSAQRRGEKIGWTFGWLGSLVWILALAGLFLYRGDWLHCALGLALFAAGVAVVFRGSPWRHPTTRYWKLMLPLYLLLLLAVVWAIWGFADQLNGLSWWYLLLLLPLFNGLFILGRRTWQKDASRTPGAGK